MKSFGDQLVGLLTKQMSHTISEATSAAKAKGGEMLAKTLVGMTEKAAQMTCATAGFKFRINMKDGKGRIGTADFRHDRIKVDIVKDRVVKAWVG